ncbi:MAG: hypothetical protein U0M81_00600 [Oscillospiraceae bacterium]
MWCYFTAKNGGAQEWNWPCGTPAPPLHPGEAYGVMETVLGDRLHQLKCGLEMTF